MHKLTVKNADDILGIVPHLLGFTPSTGDFVILGFGGTAPHARVDLPGVFDLPDMIAALEPAFNHWRSGPVALVAYTDDASLAASVFAAVSQHIEPVTTIRVHGGFFWERDGLGQPHTQSQSVLDLEAVYDRRPVASRDAFALPSLPDEVMRELFTDAEVENIDVIDQAREVGINADTTADALQVTEWLWIRDRFVDTLTPLSDEEIARFAVVADADRTARDIALVSLAHDERAFERMDWWRSIAMRSSSLSLSVLEAYAMAAYLAGSGAAAWQAIDLADQTFTGSMMTSLVGQMLEHAIPPATYQPVTYSELVAPAVRMPAQRIA